MTSNSAKQGKIEGKTVTPRSASEDDESEENSGDFSEAERSHFEKHSRKRNLKATAQHSLKKSKTVQTAGEGVHGVNKSACTVGPRNNSHVVVKWSKVIYVIVVDLLMKGKFSRDRHARFSLLKEIDKESREQKNIPIIPNKFLDLSEEKIIINNIDNKMNEICAAVLKIDNNKKRILQGVEKVIDIITNDDLCSFLKAELKSKSIMEKIYRKARAKAGASSWKLRSCSREIKVVLGCLPFLAYWHDWDDSNRKGILVNKTVAQERVCKMEKDTCKQYAKEFVNKSSSSLKKLEMLEVEQSILDLKNKREYYKKTIAFYETELEKTNNELLQREEELGEL